MTDPHTLVRLVDELVWALRRDGFDVATSQAIDVARAVRDLGWSDPWTVREAVAAVVGPRPAERARFDETLADFFSAESAAHRGTIWVRLARAGFMPAELEILRSALDEVDAASPAHGSALRRILGDGADASHAVVGSRVAASIDASTNLQLGYLTHRLLRHAGVDAARQAHAQLRAILVRALGPRGAALADAVARHVDRADDTFRAFARRTYDARVASRDRRRDGRAQTTPFASLDARQAAIVRRALRAFADRMRAVRRRVRRRRRRGPVDPHRTLRFSLRTGGVPFVLERRRRPRARPRIMVLCDVSDSVRPVAAFFLELMYALQELFESARTFVFVSNLGETTNLFSRTSAAEAVTRAWTGAGIVPTHDNSNYGRALRTFEHRHLRAVDRRTTVVVLGDGRTNRHDAAPDVLDRIRVRSRALLWLCPEPRGLWTLGDSAMARYAPKCTAVFEVACAEDLQRAARALARRAS